MVTDLNKASDLALLARTRLHPCGVKWHAFTLTPNREHWMTIDHACSRQLGHPPDGHVCHCGSRWSDE